jgi:hypothetical protein
VLEIAPATSKVRAACSDRLSRRTRGATASTAMPIGMLMKKIQRQSSSVSAPPSSSPVAPPLPTAAPQTPSARWRWRWSVNVVTTRESAAGVSSAAPRP